MATVAQGTDLVAQLGGLAILAGTLAAAGAFVYRWYVREVIPRGLALLLGLSGVAIYLNTTTALGQVIGGSSAPTETQMALFNIAAFLVGAAGATAGRRAGDWGGAELFLGDGFAEVEADVGRLVQSVGRVIAVELPQDIDDVVGYDPVPAETKETLAGKTFLFPRRLTVSDLRERLVARLKSDYGIGHVDIELADDGTVKYLALGSRAAGIGPTLPPATNAVAIRADPAFAASAGDLVQVWETDPMRRVLTAELRGVADDTVTIAIDAADTQKIDPTREYRLVTLPVEDRPDREFASLLRAADETFSSVTVEAGSPLHGLPIGALDITVVAVTLDGETPTALPDPGTVLAPGDVVFAIARPDSLRRLEAASKPLDPALVSEPTPPQRRRQTADDTAAAGAAGAAGASGVAGGADGGGPQQSASTPDKSGTAAGSETPAADRDVTGESETGSEGTITPDESETGGPVTDEPTASTADSEPPRSDDTDGTGSDDGASQESAAFDPPAAEDSDETDDSETAAGKADGSSFKQLKDEFDSGEAEWAEGESRNGDDVATTGTDDTEVAFEDDGDDSTDADPDDGGLGDALSEAGDDLDGLDIGAEADDDGGDGFDSDDDLSFDDGDDDSDFDDEDDLSNLGFEDEEADDDLSSLSFDDDEADDGLSFDEDSADTGDSAGAEDLMDSGDDTEDGESESDDGDGDGGDGDEESDGDDDDDDDDDDSGGGGASSFQQLKEEFESGDADWEDDISDSPGGDMRLDE